MMVVQLTETCFSIGKEGTTYTHRHTVMVVTYNLVHFCMRLDNRLRLGCCKAASTCRKHLKKYVLESSRRCYKIE
jgi:hypothetical protein